jgi:alpha-ribazole phosphatase
MKLYLVRHPPVLIPPGVCYGHLDVSPAIPMSGVTRRIRAQLPAEFTTWPLWTSPARRCQELAAALHRKPRIDERLLEMNFGDWEGQTWDGIGIAALNAWAADPLGFAPPGGECANDVLARALAFTHELRQNCVQNAVCITHAGVIRVLCASQQGMPQGWLTRNIPYEAVLQWPEEA